MRRATLYVSTAIGVVCAAPAYAAGQVEENPQAELPQGAVTEADAEDTDDGMIVVTATRREQRVEDIPYNISAVSGEEIEARGIVDAPELLRTVPGVAIVDRGYRNSGVLSGIFIRGLNVDSAALGDYAVSAVSTVSTYVDDTPVFSNFILNDIERVEILRGPQGTLYGSGSLGGTVRFIMRDPNPDALSGRISGTVSSTKGSDGLSWRADGVVNIPLGTNAAIRLSGALLDYAGLVDYVNVFRLDATGAPAAPNGVLDPAAEYYRKKDADTVDIKYARAAMLVEPSDALTLKLSYMYQSDDIGGRRQQTPSTSTDGFGRPYQRYENGSVQLEPSERSIHLGALEATLDLGFATLTSSSSYYDHQGDSVSENTGFYAQNNWLGAFYYNYPRPVASAARGYADKAFIQEFRLVSTTGGRFDYILGLFYQNQDLLSTQTSYLRGFKRWWDAATGLPAVITGDVDFDYRRDEKFRQLAAFGELTWHFTDRAQVTAGLRWFNNKSTNDTYIALPLFAGLAAPTDVTFDSKEKDVIFKLNASWDFAEDSMLYATVSEGYRRGGSNAVPLAGFFAENPAWLNYGPDTVTNYEVGVKGRAGAVRYNAALFNIDWDNVQLNTATPNWGFFVVQNGEEARTRGLELEVLAEPVTDLHVGLGYTYVDAKLTEDLVTPTPAHHLIARKGERLPATPKHFFNANIAYSREIGADVILNARLNWNYRSAVRNAFATNLRNNDLRLGGFSILDLSTGLQFGRLEATLFLRNLFNEKGVTGAFSEAYMGTDPSQNYFGSGAKELIATPRTLGLTLGFRY
jgi:outer membrane receptor protein involved in Fe transport